jgi:hypothetical protein
MISSLVDLIPGDVQAKVIEGVIVVALLMGSAGMGAYEMHKHDTLVAKAALADSLKAQQAKYEALIRSSNKRVADLQQENADAQVQVKQLSDAVADGLVRVRAAPVVFSTPTIAASTTQSPTTDKLTPEFLQDVVGRLAACDTNARQYNTLLGIYNDAEMNLKEQKK